MFVQRHAHLKCHCAAFAFTLREYIDSTPTLLYYLLADHQAQANALMVELCRPCKLPKFLEKER